MIIIMSQQNFRSGDLHNQTQFLAPKMMVRTAIAPPEQFL